MSSMGSKQSPGQRQTRGFENRLTRSQEDYLRSIYILSGDESSARLTDIAVRLGVSRPSASEAVTKLEKKGLVIRDANRLISLTATGKIEAKRVMDIFTVISLFLTSKLRVDRQTALVDACALEHVMSEETVNALRSTLK